MVERFRQAGRLRLGRTDLLTDIAILLGVIAVGRAIGLSNEYYHHSDFIDLGVYRMGGRGLLDGMALYDLHYEVSGLPFTYTPFAALVFAPLALLNHEHAVMFFLAATGLALLRSCWLAARETHRRVGGTWPVALLAFTLFIAALNLEPVQATMGFGQVNVLIMWLTLEDLLRPKPSRVGGALLGIATGVKLIPGLFIVFLLLTKRLRLAVGAIVATALTVAVGFVFQPSQAWLYWTGIAYDSSRVGGVAFISNQSLNGVITRFTQPGGNKIAWAVLSVVVVVVSLWTARRLWTHDARLPSIAIVATATLLASPISWSHHWVWFVILIAALLDPVMGPRTLRLGSIAVTFAVASSYIIWNVPNRGDLEYAHTALERVGGNAYTWVALALVGLATWAAAGLGPAAAESESEPDLASASASADSSPANVD